MKCIYCFFSSSDFRISVKLFMDIFRKYLSRLKLTFFLDLISVPYIVIDNKPSNQSISVIHLTNPCSEAVFQRCSVEKVTLKISQIHKKAPVPEAPPATLLKKRLVQLFYCEFCEIFKNTFFKRTPTLAASTCLEILARLAKFWGISFSLRNKNYTRRRNYQY